MRALLADVGCGESVKHPIDTAASLLMLDDQVRDMQRRQSVLASREDLVPLINALVKQRVTLMTSDIVRITGVNRRQIEDVLYEMVQVGKLILKSDSTLRNP